MNLYHARSAIPQGFADHRRVCSKIAHQGRWTVRLFGKRNAAEGGHVECSWIMPSIVRHLPVANQDRQCYYPQFTGTFSQV